MAQRSYLSFLTLFRISPFFLFISGVSYIKARSVKYDGDGTEDATGNSVAARTIGYWLIAKALLKLKLPVTIQAAILINRHLYPSFTLKEVFFVLLSFAPRRLAPWRPVPLFCSLWH